MDLTAPRRVERGPIFVGGTGRSGTSIMASLLDSHPDIVLPTHENKLIVERNGLRDLVDQLASRFDSKRRHFAVTDFVAWARKVRSFGFRDRALNVKVNDLMKGQRLPFHAAMQIVAKENPDAEFSLHGVAHAFGYEHYDRTISGFVRRISSNVDQDGIMDSEGWIRPFVTPRKMSRLEVLEQARLFLANLYQPAMAKVSASIWCDDTPSNWLYFDFLYELYPDMKFIHMIRDPREVVASYLNQVWAPSDPQIVIDTFEAQFAAYEDVRRMVPTGSVMEIRMEDLASDKDRVLHALSEFLGVENRFDGSLFSKEQANSGRRAELADSVSAAIESQLGSWMRGHGYLS